MATKEMLVKSLDRNDTTRNTQHDSQFHVYVKFLKCIKISSFLMAGLYVTFRFLLYTFTYLKAFYRVFIVRKM